MASHLQVLMRVVARGGPLSDEEAASVAHYVELEARASSNGNGHREHGKREDTKVRGEVIRLLAAAGFEPAQIARARVKEVLGVDAAQANAFAEVARSAGGDPQIVKSWAPTDPNGPLVPRTRGGSKAVSLRQVLYSLRRG